MDVDPKTLSPHALGAAYKELEEDNRHHDTALLVARVAGDEAAVGRLSQIKQAWEQGSFTGEDSREVYDISEPLFRALVESGRLIY